MTAVPDSPQGESPAARIPTLLHQVWLGPRPVPERWSRAWIRRHPRWGYRLWRETDIEAVLPDRLRPAWAYYLQRHVWHGAADVARIAILHALGGVYVDIDSEPVRSFDGAPFMRARFFVGLELGTPEAPVHITNGVIGSVQAHPILGAVIDRIEHAEDIRSPWRTVGGGFLTQAVLANRHLPGVEILPIRTFYPEDKDGRPAPGRSTVYARQYWATTHRLYDHADEGWRTLAKRRRGEPIPPPLAVRIRGAIERGLGRGSLVRRFARRAIPRRIRRAVGSLLRRPRGRR